MKNTEEILKDLEVKEILEINIAEDGKWYLYLTNGDRYELHGDNGIIKIEELK